jgi:hypothetical protein
LSTIPLLPVLGGADTRRPPDHAVFQPQPVRDGFVPPKYVKAVVDLLVASDGSLTTRPGLDTLAVLAGMRSGSLFLGDLYVHAGSSLLRVNTLSGAASTLITVSPDQPVVFCEHQGLLRWTDGSMSGYVGWDGTAVPALPQAPTPTVTPISGTLPAGRYLVSVTWVDSVGIESGCAQSAVATLTGAEALSVTVADVPAGATVRVYCSRANEAFPTWVGDSLPALLPVQITAKPASSIVCRTIGLEPLPPGAGLTTRGGFLVSWAGDLVSFSAGDWTHLHDPAHHAIQFPAPILGAVGVEGGLWVATAAGMYWVAGADLTKATLTDHADSRTYARGGVLLPANSLPLKLSLPFACFVSADGLVVGTADGQLLAPMSESQRWDVAGKRVSVALWDHNGETFIVVAGV